MQTHTFQQFCAKKHLQQSLWKGWFKKNSLAWHVWLLEERSYPWAHWQVEFRQMECSIWEHCEALEQSCPRCLVRQVPSTAMSVSIQEHVVLQSVEEHVMLPHMALDTPVHSSTETQGSPSCLNWHVNLSTTRWLVTQAHVPFRHALPTTLVVQSSLELHQESPIPNGVQVVLYGLNPVLHAQLPEEHLLLAMALVQSASTVQLSPRTSLTHSSLASLDLYPVLHAHIPGSEIIS